MISYFYNLLYSMNFGNYEVDRMMWLRLGIGSFLYGHGHCIRLCEAKIILHSLRSRFRKVRCHLRLPSLGEASFGKVLILDNLKRRGLVVIKWCNMCTKSVESVDHLFTRRWQKCYGWRSFIERALRG